MTVPNGSWVHEARESLRSTQAAPGAWGYHTGAALAAEPTALAGLALAGADEGDGQSRAWALKAAQCLARLQRADGSVSINQRLATPGWPTAHAVLLWAALDRLPEARQRAVAWLLECRGTTAEKRPDSPAGHDTGLVGWPWVEGTHSWVEPTALAVLALARLGQTANPRVEEGIRLLLDRAVPSGGWNYGNSIVLGRALRPMPGPTGLALLALAAVAPGQLSEPILAGVAYLQRVLPAIRAPQSLCWGTLGLAAWGLRPEAADSWLEQSFRQSARFDLPLQTAHALLGAGRQTLSLLGIAGPGGQ